MKIRINKYEAKNIAKFMSFALLNFYDKTSGIFGIECVEDGVYHRTFSDTSSGAKKYHITTKEGKIINGQIRFELDCSFEIMNGNRNITKMRIDNIVVNRLSLFVGSKSIQVGNWELLAMWVGILTFYGRSRIIGENVNYTFYGTEMNFKTPYV